MPKTPKGVASVRFGRPYEAVSAQVIVKCWTFMDFEVVMMGSCAPTINLMPCICRSCASLHVYNRCISGKMQDTQIQFGLSFIARRHMILPGALLLQTATKKGGVQYDSHLQKLRMGI